MILLSAASRILLQLSDLIAQIDASDFSKPLAILGGSTIGEHVRHTLEFFECFAAGCLTGTINYDKRMRDRLLETDKRTAALVTERTIRIINELEARNDLKLEVKYDSGEEGYISVDTNTMRELVYNIEHAVHHMAIIKIGIREAAPYVELDDTFGMAASTVRHIAKPRTVEEK